jgi:electron transfer flavoprotein beta subunit
MKILVCIKQVPDPESSIEIDPGARWITDHKGMVYRMNRYDEYALEEAVLIREALENVTVEVVSVGPARAAAVLKKGLEKGADNAIHIIDENAGYRPPALTAARIADYAGTHGYDLIFTGVMAEDDMQSQVGPLIAARLELPCATSVTKETLDKEGGVITAECELEGGSMETVALPLPCLLAIQSGINRPRYPSLSNVFRAKDQALMVIDDDATPAAVPHEDIVSLLYPPRSTKGMVLAGTSEEKAEQLLTLLHEKSFL